MRVGNCAPETMNHTRSTLSDGIAVRPSGPIRLGAVGLGSRAAAIIHQLVKVDSELRLEALVDPDEQACRARINEQEIPIAEHMITFEDVDAMLDAGPMIDALIIGTRCHLHAELAIKLARLQLPLFLEKPVAITWDEVNALREKLSGQSDSIVVSFPLRRTPLFAAVQKIIRSGRLGTMNQVQAINNVPYGAVYVDSWYQDYNLCGGLWLQKATHDFDYIHHLVGDTPKQVTAMQSRMVWQEPVLHHDAASAIVKYASGVHANYSQNFITRQSAGRRGAIITGSDATVHFDWRAESATVIDHSDERVDTIKIHPGQEDNHRGGDIELARNFIGVIRGREKSITTLIHGLTSAATCLATRDAAWKATVEVIPAQDGRPSTELCVHRIEPPQ